MAKIIIKGKPKLISKEEARGLIHATMCILEYHHKTHKGILVRFVSPRKLGEDRVGDHNKVSDGRGIIRIANNQNFSETATIIIHEMIHAYMFSGADIECITSTLGSKLKSDVIKLANILIDNTYRVAAYMAHTKMSYVPFACDHYNKNEWHQKHDMSKGIKYR